MKQEPGLFEPKAVQWDREPGQGMPWTEPARLDMGKSRPSASLGSQEAGDSVDAHKLQMNRTSNIFTWDGRPLPETVRNQYGIGCGGWKLQMGQMAR